MAAPRSFFRTPRRHFAAQNEISSARAGRWRNLPLAGCAVEGARNGPSRAAKILIFLATCALIGSAQAQDIELGRYLAQECMTCHGASSANSAIPNIFGTDPATFAVVMKSYRSKELPNPVMQNVAARLKDDEIEALAAFFATAKRP